MSVNGYFGDYDHTRAALGQMDYRVFLSTREFTVPGPCMTWIFVDEHPDSINDGFFGEWMTRDDWNDVPASYHGGAACFAFADGHAEIHKWLDGITKAPILKRSVCSATGQVSPRDIQWMHDHTTALK